MGADDTGSGIALLCKRHYARSKIQGKTPCNEKELGSGAKSYCLAAMFIKSIGPCLSTMVRLYPEACFVYFRYLSPDDAIKLSNAFADLSNTL